MRAPALLLLVSLLVSAPLAGAEVISEEVEGHTVTVTVAEPGTSSSDTGTTTTRRSWVDNGVAVDEAGAHASVTYLDRDTAVSQPAFTLDQTEDRFTADVSATDGSVLAAQQASVGLVQRDVTASGEWLEADFVTIQQAGFVWTGSVLLWSATSSSSGVGSFSPGWAGVATTTGTIHFVNTALLAQAGIAGHGLSVSSASGVGEETRAGDWNGAFYSWSTSLTRCQGLECQATTAGTAGCLVGYRPALFLDCVP